MSSLPELLTLDDIMARYKVRDRRTARWIARAAGAVRIGGRILVSVDRLAQWEHEQAEKPDNPVDEVPRGARRASGRSAPPRKPAGDHGEKSYWFWDDAA